MDKCDKLLAAAEASPSSLSFDDLCKLAECYGFEFKRQKGTSHRMYGHPSLSASEGGFMIFSRPGERPNHIKFVNYYGRSEV
jgi:hypothetical protein